MDCQLAIPFFTQQPTTVEEARRPVQRADLPDHADYPVSIVRHHMQMEVIWQPPDTLGNLGMRFQQRLPARVATIKITQADRNFVNALLTRARHIPFLRGC